MGALVLVFCAAAPTVHGLLLGMSAATLTTRPRPRAWRALLTVAEPLYCLGVKLCVKAECRDEFLKVSYGEPQLERSVHH